MVAALEWNLQLYIPAFLTSFPILFGQQCQNNLASIPLKGQEHEQLSLLFPLKASLAKDEVNVNAKWVKLKLGMSVMVEVKTGTRRLLDFYKHH